jgi:hypothetical protein
MACGINVSFKYVLFLTKDMRWIKDNIDSLYRLHRWAWIIEGIDVFIAVIYFLGSGYFGNTKLSNIDYFVMIVFILVFIVCFIIINTTYLILRKDSERRIALNAIIKKIDEEN